MIADIQSLLFGRFEKPNCRITVCGEHYFTDRKLYSNMYGIAFFPEGKGFGDNPHIFPSCKNLPGILDEYFPDEIAAGVNTMVEYPIRDAIMANIPEQFITQPQKRKDRNASIACAYDGYILRQESGAIIFSYGDIIPTALCIMGDDSISTFLPFSPFPNLSFAKSERVFQSLEYLLPTEPLEPPNDLTVDFSVLTKKMEIDLSDELFGRIVLEYSIDVGVTRCESSKLVFKIAPPDDSD